MDSQVHTNSEEKKSGDFFAVVGEHSLKFLPIFLRRRRYNGYSIGSADKRGKPLIGLSWQWSDWKFDKRGLICCNSLDLRLKAQKIVEEFITKEDEEFCG